MHQRDLLWHHRSSTVCKTPTKGPFFGLAFDFFPESQKWAGTWSDRGLSDSVVFWDWAANNSSQKKQG